MDKRGLATDDSHGYRQIWSSNKRRQTLFIGGHSIATYAVKHVLDTDKHGLDTDKHGLATENSNSQCFFGGWYWHDDVVLFGWMVLTSPQRHVVWVDDRDIFTASRMTAPEISSIGLLTFALGMYACLAVCIDLILVVVAREETPENIASWRAMPVDADYVLPQLPFPGDVYRSMY